MELRPWPTRSPGAWGILIEMLERFQAWALTQSFGSSAVSSTVDFRRSRAGPSGVDDRGRNPNSVGARTGTSDACRPPDGRFSTRVVSRSAFLSRGVRPSRIRPGPMSPSAVMRSTHPTPSRHPLDRCTEYDHGSIGHRTEHLVSMQRPPGNVRSGLGGTRELPLFRPHVTDIDYRVTYSESVMIAKPTAVRPASTTSAVPEATWRN